MTDLERLIGLARFARITFEKVAERDQWPYNLGGLCFSASFFLHKLAENYGIKTEIGHGIGHWFVLFEDKVVDITATQFGVKEKIAVLSIEEAEKCGGWWELQNKWSQTKSRLTNQDRYLDRLAHEEASNFSRVGEGEL